MVGREVPAEELSELIEAIYSAALDAGRAADIFDRLSEIFPEHDAHKTAATLSARTGTIEISQSRPLQPVHSTRLNTASADVMLNEHGTSTRSTSKRRLSPEIRWSGPIETAVVAYMKGRIRGRAGRAQAVLVGHLRRALDIRRSVVHAQLAQEISCKALRQLGLVLFIVDSEGKIYFADTAALDFLRGQDGLCLRDSRIAASSRAMTDILHNIFANTAAGASSSKQLVVRLPCKARSPLIGSTFPAPHGRITGVPGDRRVVFLVRDPEGATQQLKGATYGFTPTQAELAAMLMVGATVAEFAAFRGIGLHTARTHLKAILHKTATSRQGELVARLLRETIGIGM